MKAGDTIQTEHGAVHVVALQRTAAGLCEWAIADEDGAVANGTSRGEPSPLVLTDIAHWCEKRREAQS